MGLYDDMMVGARIARGFFRFFGSAFRFIKKNTPKFLNFAKKSSSSISKKVDKLSKK